MAAQAAFPILAPRSEAVRRESALQTLLTTFVSSGLAFLLLPGTFLGVWNLIAISGHRSAHSLSPAWIQAHGHAQIFGWIGSFILGIGFHSLSKMGAVSPASLRSGWLSWSLWTVGVAARWFSGVYAWHWRLLFPLSSAFELAAFLVFFATVRRHKPASASSAAPQAPIPIWMRLVLASTVVFLLTLLLGLAGSIAAAVSSSEPAFGPSFDRRYLLLSAWGFLVLSIWGFNARWLPVFLGLPQPRPRALLAAFSLLVSALALGFLGLSTLPALILIAASLASAYGLHVFEHRIQPAKTVGVHRSFPFFVRLTYVWLLIASSLTLAASLADRNGGFTGASRHALTVGFAAAMVFAIGQRVLPAFCGMRLLFSKRLMFASLALLNAGCLLRVASEIPAYEGFYAPAWRLLPVSAAIELTAVALFCFNLLVTVLRPPVRSPAVL